MSFEPPTADSGEPALDRHLGGGAAGRDTARESGGKGPGGGRGLAISARGLTKIYQVYSRPQHRLWQMLWRGRRTFYREFSAVRGVDLDVFRGETVGIVGRNGSGKSTLLRMICGTLEPTSGQLEIDGHVAPLLMLGAGFNREFTGRENVFMNAAILGLSDEDVRDRLDEIIAFADIGDFFDQPVKSYSAGMYSRLAFAVAVHSDPDILVIDEILAVGDEAFNRKCFARIDQIKAAGATILFVSHSADRVVELCDRAILMEAGERLLTADPKTVISRYKRLIHAPDDLVTDISQEIRELDGDRASIDDPIGVVIPRGSGGEISARCATEDADGFGYFDPGLKPESTVDFLQRGARIANARVLNPRGACVNVLHAGRVYTYAYEVEFSESVAGVRFGMMLKPVSGFELAGQVSHPAGEGIEFVEAGVTARVRFRFKASLVRGAYFLNAGVLGRVDGAEQYLHRILDAVMFRILPQQQSRTTGRIDLSPEDGDCFEVELCRPGS